MNDTQQAQIRSLPRNGEGPEAELIRERVCVSVRLPTGLYRRLNELKSDYRRSIQYMIGRAVETWVSEIDAQQKRKNQPSKQ